MFIIIMSAAHGRVFEAYKDIFKRLQLFHFPAATMHTGASYFPASIDIYVYYLYLLLVKNLILNNCHVHKSRI